MAMVLGIYVYIQYHTNMESVRIVLDTPVRRKMSTSVEMIRTTSNVHTVTITAHNSRETDTHTHTHTHTRAHTHTHTSKQHHGHVAQCWRHLTS